MLLDSTISVLIILFYLLLLCHIIECNGCITFFSIFFIVEWATFVNNRLRHCPGSYISNHCLTAHVRRNLALYLGKSKFVRYHNDGQTIRQTVWAIQARLARWTAHAFSSGHPPHHVAPAQKANHVIITIRRPTETGHRTLETPHGTKTFPQTFYSLVVHEVTGVVSNAYPSEGAISTDGSCLLQRSELLFLF